MALLDSNIIIYACRPQYSFLNDWIVDVNAAASKIVIPETLGHIRLDRNDERIIESIIRRIRMLDVTDSILREAANLRRQRRMSLGDAIIAATALEHGVALVTRNVSDFKHLFALTLINPFND